MTGDICHGSLIRLTHLDSIASTEAQPQSLSAGTVAVARRFLQNSNRSGEAAVVAKTAIYHRAPHLRDD